MRIQNIKFSTNGKNCMLSAQLVLSNGKKHDIYFEIDKKYQDYSSQDASPFLAAALPIAMIKLEPLEIDGVISEKLYKNTSKLMAKMHRLDSSYKPVAIKETKTIKDIRKGNGVGVFFSSGVDSFYTYLKNKSDIDHLIFVHGFDIKPDDFELFARIEKNITKIAIEENVNLIKVRTNIRETFEEYFDWHVAHEFGIASVSLFLRAGLKEIYVSCGQATVDSEHEFLNPDLDILWSTEHLFINHYGCSADKILKIRYLSRFKVVMDNLRVCWANKNNSYNCSECVKCFRNILALYVVGTLRFCKTFTPEIDLAKLRTLRVDDNDLKYFVTLMETMDSNNDRSNVSSALSECLSRNLPTAIHKKWFRQTRDTVRVIDKKYNKARLFWFLTRRNVI